jgi:FKBP-type peptidyl-prolyl cis-trans isomerase 2
MISEGSAVKIHYTLQVEGEIIDTSKNREPLSYVQGEGQILNHLENHLLGKNVGDKFTVTLDPEEGYGLHNPNAIQSVPNAAFDDPGAVKVGAEVGINAEDGNVYRAVVTEKTDDTVTLDMNHPLAGKELEFDVEVVEVNNN